MAPTVNPRIPLALAALAFAGCGLAEYEKKMGETEARLQRFDEEDRLLGDPLVLPVEGPPLFVFLRPPKGIAKDFGTQQGDWPYHYPATAGAFSDLYLLFGADDGRESLEKQIADRFGVRDLTWQPVEVRPADRPAIASDAVEFIDPRAPANAPANGIAYIHQTDGRPPVGVVFRVAQANLTPANRPAIDAAVRMSLATYREADDAQKARADYAKWRGH